LAITRLVIAAFAFARLDAYNDAGLVIVWHEQ
jgi:hypothetical protein